MFMQVPARRAAVAFAALGIACLASADDWRMFRRDTGRTAASEESIALPLKEYWSWQGLRVKNASALSTVAIRDGRAYFAAGGEQSTSPGGAKRTYRELICADAKTGDVHWRKRLELSRAHSWLPEDIGPALTKDGTIFVFDKGVPCKTCETGFTIEALDQSGKVLDSAQVPNKETLARFFLRSGHGNETDYLLFPGLKPDH